MARSFELVSGDNPFDNCVRMAEWTENHQSASDGDFKRELKSQKAKMRILK